jgi:hypothetical protein
LYRILRPGALPGTIVFMIVDDLQTQISQSCISGVLY